MWVFDATPLIYLAKVGRLRLVDDLNGACVIPQPVYEEVVETGVEQGYPDARRIESAVETDHFEIVPVETTDLRSRLEENTRLSDADGAVLAYARAHEAVAVMDETYGRDVATTEGVTTRGTAFLVLKLAMKEVLDVDEARTVIDEMLDAGWYCAPSVYSRIVQTLEGLED